MSSGLSHGLTDNYWATKMASHIQWAKDVQSNFDYDRSNSDNLTVQLQNVIVSPDRHDSYVAYLLISNSN